MSRSGAPLPAIAVATLAILGVAWLTSDSGGDAAGGGYPSDTVRIIIPYTAGSGTDNVSRIIADEVTRQTGTPFVIVNRPGGGSIIGVRELARAAPDGYTLGMIDPAFAINPILHESLPYDTQADFRPISLLTTNPLVLTIPTSLPSKTLKEFLAYVRAAEQPLAYASPGYGSAGHLAFLQFLEASGLEMVHIPYRGSGATIKDLLASRITVTFLSENTALPHIRAGNLRALAATGPEGASLLPEVPSFREAGLPSVSLRTFAGLIAPSGVSDGRVDKINDIFAEALSAPRVRDQFSRLGLTAVASSPDAFARFLSRQTRVVGDVITPLGEGEPSS